jgi:hypothetical protein
VFVVDPNLIVLAESVRVRDWVPEPGKSISKRSGNPLNGRDCGLSLEQSRAEQSRAEIRRLESEHLTGITGSLSTRGRWNCLVESCALTRNEKTRKRERETL